MANPQRPAPKPTKQPQSRFGNLVVYGIILIFIIAIVYMFTSSDEEISEFNYSTFISEIEDNKIKTAVSTPVSGNDNAGAFLITGTYIDVDGKTKDYSVVIPSEEVLTLKWITLKLSVADK